MNVMESRLDVEKSLTIWDQYEPFYESVGPKKDVKKQKKKIST